MEVSGAWGRRQGQGAADTPMVVQGTVCQQLLPAGGLKKLSIIGRALRKCVSLDPCLFVVSHALDSMFDVFGDDDCPAAVFWELEMLPVLEELASKFSSRVRRKGRGGRERSNLHASSFFFSQMSNEPRPVAPSILSAKANLPHFIDYMKSKALA